MRILTIILAVFFLGACTKEPDRALVLKCTGDHITTDSENPKNSELNKTIKAYTSAYLGPKEFTMDTERYQICAESKTAIEFADDCKNPTEKGSYDLVFNKLITTKKSKTTSLKFDYRATCQTAQQIQEEEQKQKALQEERSSAIAKIEEPEQCILNASKGGNQNYSSAYAIRDNCNKLYEKQVETYAQSLPIDLFSNATITFNPAVSVARPNPYLEVRLKNNSNSKLIYGFIVISTKGNPTPDYYKVYADGPISPYTVGTMSAIIDGSKPDIWAPNYWSTHSWYFQSIYGLGAP